MKVEVDIASFDEFFVAKMKETENYILQDIGRAILPCKDFQFEDLYNNFKMLEQIRAVILYHEGNYDRPLSSPNPEYVVKEISKKTSKKKKK